MRELGPVKSLHAGPVFRTLIFGSFLFVPSCPTSGGSASADNQNQQRPLSIVQAANKWSACGPNRDVRLLQPRPPYPLNIMAGSVSNLLPPDLHGGSSHFAGWRARRASVGYPRLSPTILSAGASLPKATRKCPQPTSQTWREYHSQKDGARSPAPFAAAEVERQNLRLLVPAREPTAPIQFELHESSLMGYLEAWLFQCRPLIFTSALRLGGSTISGKAGGSFVLFGTSVISRAPRS